MAAKKISGKFYSAWITPNPTISEPFTPYLNYKCTCGWCSLKGFSVLHWAQFAVIFAIMNTWSQLALACCCRLQGCPLNVQTA